MNNPHRRISPALICVALVLVLGCICQAEEVIVLNSGAQYRCRVERIDDGKIHFVAGGEHITADLSNVERIEFERTREFDGIETAEGLSRKSTLFAEALAVKTADLKAEFPQAGYVILKDDTVIRVSEMNASGTGSYTVERTRVWKILEQRGADVAMQSIRFFPMLQRPEVLFGITVGPDGAVARISDAAIKDEAVYPEHPDYDYLHRLRFTLKNPVPGATLFLKTRITGKATLRVPLVVDRTFWHSEPAVRQSVRIEAAPGNLALVDVATTGKIDRPDGKDFWVVRDAPQVFWESLMPPVASFAPRLLAVYPKASWKELPAALAGSSTSITPTPRAAVTDKAPEEIYNRVRRNIRLVNVPQDALPLPPAKPAKVLEKGYGTALEKALVLKALLTGQGYDASVALAASRGQGPFIEQVARLKGLDAAVVILHLKDGGVQWLQCDQTKRGFGELAADIQGSKALNLRTGQIVTVPVRPCEDEHIQRQAQVAIAADGSAVVTEHYALTGHEAGRFRFIADLSDDDAHKWAASFVGNNLPGTDLIKFSHSAFEDCNRRETLDFVYRVPNLARKSGKFLIARLPNAKYSPVEVGRSTRQWGLFWKGYESEGLKMTLRAPSGYSIYALPEGLVRKEAGWELDAGFTSEDDGAVVVFHENWRRTILQAARDAYSVYREALISRGRLRNEMIVFERKEP